MAFAGVSLVADGELCALTASPINACAYRGYHLLVVEGYSRNKDTTPTGEYIKSHPFLVGGHRWRIDYYPNGFTDDDEEFMSIFLLLDDEVEVQEVKAQCFFSFIDQPELRMSARIQKNEIQSDNCYAAVRFIRRDVLERSRHLKSGSFIIRCDIDVLKTVADTSTNEGTHTIDSSAEMPLPDIQSHLRDLFLSKEGADITFDVGGKTFAAHRFMLAARSTLFKAQLSGGTTMTGTNVVEVNNMEPGIFSALLAFIYTDSFPNWIEDDEKPASGDNEEEEETKSGEDEEEEETKSGEDEEEEDGTESYVTWLLQLLEAADTYDLQRLRSICEENLAEYICMDSVTDIIVVAERRKCRWLKDACSEFIKTHSSLYTVFTADSLDQIITACSPSVLKELLSKFAL